MKKHFLIAILLLFFVACKTPTKVVDHATTKVVDHTQIDVEQKTETTEKSTTHSVVDIGENSTIVEETTIKQYDTTQPVDVETGQYPVKVETTTRKITTTDKQIKEQLLSIANNTEKNEVVDKTKLDVEIDTTITHEETPKTPQIAYLFYIILIVVISAAGWFLNSKFKWINRIFGV